MIKFLGCTRVLIEGITVLDAPMWIVHMAYYSSGVIRDVTIESPGQNNDGIVLDSSERFLVADNHIHTGDDSIVIKSGRDEDGWRIGRPSQDIVIRNNFMEGHNALVIGSELSGGIRRIFMNDNRLGDVRSAIYLKSNLDRGGYVQQVRIAGTTIEKAEMVIRINTDYPGYRGGRQPTCYQDVFIENVHVRETITDVLVEVEREASFQNIKVTGLRIDEVINRLSTAEIRKLWEMGIEIEMGEK